MLQRQTESTTDELFQIPPLQKKKSELVNVQNAQKSILTTPCFDHTLQQKNLKKPNK